MRQGLGAAVMAVLTAAGPAGADDAAPPSWDTPGARVRVRAADHGQLKGTVIGQGDGLLSLRLRSGERVDLPLGSIERLERSLGRETPLAVEVAWIGLGVGLGATIAASGVEGGGSRAEAVLGGALATLLFLGLAEPPSVERWEEVAAGERRAQWSLSPSVGASGVGLRLGLTF